MPGLHEIARVNVKDEVAGVKVGELERGWSSYFSNLSEPLKIAQNNLSLSLPFILPLFSLFRNGKHPLCGIHEDVKYTGLKRALVRRTHVALVHAGHARARPRASRSKSWHKQLHPTYPIYLPYVSLHT